MVAAWKDKTDAATDKALDRQLDGVLDAQDDVDAAADGLAVETAELAALEAEFAGEDGGTRPDRPVVLPTAPYALNTAIIYTTANLLRVEGNEDRYVEESSVLEAFEVATKIGTFTLPSVGSGKARRVSAELSADGVPGTFRLA